MSMIVHGPQGCGKTRNGELLRRHFKLSRIVDCGLGCDLASAYTLLSTAHKREVFKGGNTLYLTSEPPPAHLDGARRIVSFDEAMRQIRPA